MFNMIFDIQKILVGWILYVTFSHSRAMSESRLVCLWSVTLDNFLPCDWSTQKILSCDWLECFQYNQTDPKSWEVSVHKESLQMA